MYLKTLFTLSLTTFLCFSLNSLLAQPPQYRGQVNNIIRNNEMRMQNQMMMQMAGMCGVMVPRRNMISRLQ